MLHGRYKIDNTSPLRIRRSYSICKKLRISAAILAEQTELLEIVTYGFAAHQRAHHIEEVGVRNVPHPRGHPPAEGGVHEFNKLFVERGSQGAPSRSDVRERGLEEGHPEIRKIES